MRNFPPALAISLVAAVAFTPGCRTVEHAEEETAIDQTTFAMADSDDDGRLSERELAGHLHQEALAEFDLDGDRRISPSEWASARPSAEGDNRHFKRLDKNGNGQVEEEEALLFVTEHASFSSVFDELDQDEDDHLHWEEIAEAEPRALNVTLFSIPE